MSTETEHTDFEGSDIERRLRRDLSRVTVRVPPNIVSRAHRAHRRNRAVTRAAAIAGTAAVIGVAVTLVATNSIPFSAAASGPASPASSLPPGGVPKATSRPTPPGDGLSAGQAAGDILWVHTITTDTPAGDSSVSNTFTYGYTSTGLRSSGARDRYITYTAQGTPVQDASMTETPTSTGSTSVSTWVSYTDRSWSRTNGLIDGRATPDEACPVITGEGLGGVDFAATPDATRALLTCPSLKVARGVRVDGIAAIKIADRRGGTLWINAATYLPIQGVNISNQHELERLTAFGPGSGATSGKQVSSVSYGPGSGATSGKQVSSVSYYGYLPATTANLARLTAPVPAGFTHDTADDTPPVKYAPTWTPPPGAIPPYSLAPVAASDGLTHARAARDILWVHTTLEAMPSSDAIVDNSFFYQSASRDLEYYPDGEPWFDASAAVIPGRGGMPVWAQAYVYYDRHDYGTGTMPAVLESAPLTCSALAQGNLFSTLSPSGHGPAGPDLAAGVQSLLNCPGLTVTRGVTLDGVDAVRVIQGDETLWVNATTYLPIELVITNAKGHYPDNAYHRAPSPGMTIQYTWLPATPADLSYLAAVIPAGFKKA